MLIKALHQRPPKADPAIQAQSIITTMSLPVAKNFGTRRTDRACTELFGAIADLMLRLSLMRSQSAISLGCAVVKSAIAFNATTTLAQELTANNLAKRDHSFEHALIKALHQRLKAASRTWLQQNDQFNAVSSNIDAQREYLGGNRTAASLTGAWVTCICKIDQEVSERDPPKPSWQTQSAIRTAHDIATNANDDANTAPDDIKYPPEFTKHLRFSDGGRAVTGYLAKHISEVAKARSLQLLLRKKPWRAYNHPAANNLYALRDRFSRTSVPHILEEGSSIQAAWLRNHPDCHDLLEAIETRIKSDYPTATSVPRTADTCLLCLARGVISDAKGSHSSSLECLDTSMRNLHMKLYKTTESYLEHNGSPEFFTNHIATINPQRSWYSSLLHKGGPTETDLKMKFPCSHATGFMLFPAANNSQITDPLSKACLNGYQLILPNALAIRKARHGKKAANLALTQKYIQDQRSHLCDIRLHLQERLEQEAVPLLTYLRNVRAAAPPQPPPEENEPQEYYAEEVAAGVNGGFYIVETPPNPTNACAIDNCKNTIATRTYDEQSTGDICPKCTKRLQREQRTHSLGVFYRELWPRINNTAASPYVQNPVEVGLTMTFLPVLKAFSDHTRAKHKILASAIEGKKHAKPARTLAAALLYDANIPYADTTKITAAGGTKVEYAPNNPARWCFCATANYINREMSPGSLALDLYNHPEYHSLINCSACFRLKREDPPPTPPNQQTRSPCYICKTDTDPSVDVKCVRCHRWMHDPRNNDHMGLSDSPHHNYQRRPIPEARCTATADLMRCGDNLGQGCFICCHCVSRIAEETADDHCATFTPSISIMGGITVNPYTPAFDVDMDDDPLILEADGAAEGEDEHIFTAPPNDESPLQDADEHMEVEMQIGTTPNYDSSMPIERNDDATLEVEDEPLTSTQVPTQPDVTPLSVGARQTAQARVSVHPPTSPAVTLSHGHPNNTTSTKAVNHITCEHNETTNNNPTPQSQPAAVVNEGGVTATDTVTAPKKAKRGASSKRTGKSKARSRQQRLEMLNAELNDVEVDDPAGPTETHTNSNTAGIPQGSPCNDPNTDHLDVGDLFDAYAASTV
jgi:hypothetical protein